ncbi:PIN domain-containing protein [Chitinophaga vietnamensis]|uniref:type II toxin-antitoxin system VapC family toxin n=1 Tax=Chitinophaga vietnamensis TaxID=2593957 RepID=UPI001177E211|nr:type II toxin-antitoxin system VapC family toxin [Chitinophaga vietnamensis]
MLSVYADTSVIGGCFDIEFMEFSNVLFEEFKTGIKRLVISDVVEQELVGAPIAVRLKLFDVPDDFKTRYNGTTQTETLADAYIAAGALSNKSFDDAHHIAIATLSGARVLASWNFKHVVNLDKIKLYNFINLQMGYPTIEIRTPREILKPVNYEENQNV